MTMIGGSWVLAAVLAGTPQAAPEQPSPESAGAEETTEAAAPGSDRKGFLIGFAIGRGRFDCEGCGPDGGFALDFSLGGAIGKRVALMATFGVIGRQENRARDRIDVSRSLATLQFWMLPRLWASGGIGYGRYEIEVGQATHHSDTSLALAVGAGVEVVRGRRFALDLRGRYTRLTKLSTDDATLMLGFTWY